MPRQGENAEQARPKLKKKIGKLEEALAKKTRELEQREDGQEEASGQDRLREKIRECEAKLNAAQLLATMTEANGEKCVELQPV